MNNKNLLKLLVYTSLAVSGTAYADDVQQYPDVRGETAEGEIPEDQLLSGDGADGCHSNYSGTHVILSNTLETCSISIKDAPPTDPQPNGPTGEVNPSGGTFGTGGTSTNNNTEQSQTDNTSVTGTSPAVNDQSQTTHSDNTTGTTTSSANGGVVNGTTGTGTTGTTNSLGDIITNSSNTANNTKSNTTPQNWGAPPQEEYADHWAVTRPRISVLIDISNKVKNKTKLKFNCTSNGCAIDNGDNTITYTPASHFVGSSGIAEATDTFSYTYTDEYGESKSGIVKVKVMDDRHYWNFVSNWNMGGYWTYNDSKSSYWDYVGVDQNGNYYSQGQTDNYWSYEGQNSTDQNWVSDSNDPNYWSYYGDKNSSAAGSSILSTSDYWSYTGTKDKRDFYGAKPDDFLTWSLPAACQLIYAVHDEGLKDSQLLTIDPKKGYTSVPLGPLHKSYDIEAMGISPTNHRLYALAGGSAAKDYRGGLYVVDPRTGDLALLGKSGFDDITAIAFHPNGTLWAWSKGVGIIQINPETGQGVIRARFTTLEMEGLAWSTDGSVLYATENENLWIYTGGSLAKTCNNFPGQVEALETLNGGLLLFAVDKDQGNNIYAYDPQSCTIVSSGSFVTMYSDIESISWASRCNDEYKELSAWSGKFNHDQGFMNEEGDELVCLEKAQWITATASISLEPLASLAHLETNWEVVTPQKTACPPKRDQYGRVVQLAEDNCLVSDNPLQMTTGKSEFSISAWWPGMVKDSEEVTEVLFKTRILDLNGDPLPGYEEPITKRVRGVCGAEKSVSATTDDEAETLVNVADEKAQPAVDTAALEQYFYDVLKANEVSITEEGDVTVTIDNMKYSGVLSILLPEAEVSNNGELSFEQVPDLNADGYDDYIITYPDGQQQQLFYLGMQPIEEVVDVSTEIVANESIEDTTSDTVDEVVEDENN
jgi:hypothetical protein